ncbi:class I SAM-dependent methyltransferase [Patescibacteria group bacterium]|nr:class I SAM-dependent methyltransferase [Patescibacteria group bacterium]
MIQSKAELEDFFKQHDPWGYEENKDDARRKDVLLSEIPDREYNKVLDIGCGHGFITRDLPGKNIVGVDISDNAVKQAGKYANDRIGFMQADVFELNDKLPDKFDLIVITGVLYPQYIGNSVNLVYLIIDKLLKPDGILVSVHIDEWYQARFPYLLLKQYFYDYREYSHRLEVCIK